MKLDETGREFIVTFAWIIAFCALLMALVIFVQSTITWVMVKLLMVSVGFGLTARWFMGRDHD